MAVPSCLTSWVLNEITSILVQSRNYIGPTLAKILAKLYHRMMPSQTHAGARAEFKMQGKKKKEGLREFSRRVRSLGDIANANIGAQDGDDKDREQFVDVELQDQLYKDDLGTKLKSLLESKHLSYSTR